MERDAKHVLTELLVLRAQGGDESAFAELFDLWRRDLMRFLQTRLGRADQAEETAQAAWVAIARRLGGLGDPACFPRWAFCIASRKAADLIRHWQRERRRAAVLDARAHEVPLVATEGVPAAASDEMVRLQEAVRCLDAATRELLSLYYETGLSVAEIAGIQDVPEGTVKSRLYHAREQLKRLIERSPS